MIRHPRFGVLTMAPENSGLPNQWIAFLSTGPVRYGMFLDSLRQWVAIPLSEVEVI